MFIVHLSDIHFQSAEVASGFDPNANLREDFLKDIETQIQSKSQKPDAIIVSGDIAFAGQQQEYEFAKTWFEKLCGCCEVEYERLFFVPGNHDVDRTKSRSPVVVAMHRQIRECDSAQNLRRELVQFLEDPVAGEQLHASLEAYNEFALGLDCAFSAPGNTAIHRDLKFSDGSTLRIWGFNTSLFCGGILDNKGALVVDPSFERMREKDNIVNLAVSHHPSSWLRNESEFKAHIDQHATIQLSGHEHANAVDIGQDKVLVRASALHPERTVGPFEPGYNLIDIELLGRNDNRELKICVEVREAQARPAEFKSKMNQGKPYFEAIVKLPSWSPPEAAAYSTDKLSQSGEADFMVDPTKNFRVISLEFLALKRSARLRIAIDLDLTSQDEDEMSDFGRSKNILYRAKDRNQLSELALAIEEQKNTR